MKKLIPIVLFLVYQLNVYSQSETDYSQIINQVCELYEKDNVIIYNNLDNGIYEYELFLLDKDENNPESEILKFVKINYKELRKLYRKTNKKAISEFYSTRTSENFKDKNIAVIAIPIISRDGNSAIIFGRYSCGLLCGQTTMFYFNKNDKKWQLTDFKEIK